MKIARFQRNTLDRKVVTRLSLSNKSINNWWWVGLCLSWGMSLRSKTPFLQNFGFYFSVTKPLRTRGAIKCIFDIQCFVILFWLFFLQISLPLIMGSKFSVFSLFSFLIIFTLCNVFFSFEFWQFFSSKWLHDSDSFDILLIDFNVICISFK